MPSQGKAATLAGSVWMWPRNRSRFTEQGSRNAHTMKRMEAVRKLADMSKAELARQARLHPTDVGKIEAGRLIPYGSQLRRIATALDYEGEPVDLLDDLQPS
jgi:ribosome-binding protein aMBF1 (putative translation factor)